MQILIQNVRFDVSKRLRQFVNSKAETLKSLDDKITRVTVYLKLDNVGKTIKDKIAGIKVHIAKHKPIYVEHATKSFEESFDKALGSVKETIKRKTSKVAMAA